MINTIFYFPESLTFNEYINKLDKDADDGISKRTIVFAEEQGRIYKNGLVYGTNTYDVQNLIELNRYDDEYVRAAIEQLEHDLQDESDAIDLQGLQYLALAGRVKTIEDHGYVNEAEILTAVAGEVDGSTQKSSIRNKINNVAKEASAALFAEVSDSNDYITAQSIVNAITTNTTARTNLASSFTTGDNQMWAAAFTQADLSNSSSALYAALRDKANDNEVVKKASVIASINSSGESNVSISADKINLNGNVIAQRLIAASAALGGFVIEQNALVGTTTESGNITRSVILMPAGLQFNRTDTNGTSVSSDDTVLQKLEINPVDGIKFTQNNSNVSSWLKMDGSGSLANGSLAWSTDGGLMVKTDGIVVDSEHDWELFGRSGTQKGLAAFDIVGNYDQLATAIYWDCDRSEYVYDYSRNDPEYVSDTDITVAMASNVWGKPGAIFDGSGVGISLFNPSINSSWLNAVKNHYVGPNSTGRVGLAGATNEIHPWTNLRASVFDSWTGSDGIPSMGLYISSSAYVDGYAYVYGDLKVYSNTELFGTCTAGSFIKEGSSNDYVLLAGGGTKALSEFTTNGASVYFPLTGGSLNGHLINKQYSVLTGSIHITNPSGTIDTLLRTTIETSEDASYFSIADMSDVTNHYYTIGNLTGHDQLTVEGELLCIGSATATSFIKTNGTSSLFLKADGSVDGTSYLPLTGGTMTGALTIDGSLMSGGYALDVDGVARVSGNVTLSSTLSISDSNYGYADIDIYSNGLRILTGNLTGQQQLYVNGKTTVTGNVTANSLIKSGGTSSEVLMADGSVTNLVSYLDLSSNESVYEGSGGDWSTNTFTLPAGRWNYSFYLKGQLDVWAGDGTNLISVQNMSTNQTITSTYDYDNTDTYSSASRYTIPFVLSAPTKVRISVSDGNGAMLYIYKPMISHGEYAPKI